MQNILLIKLRYLGDVVLCTPLLPLLRNRFPEATITFLVNPGTSEILARNPYLDTVWELPRQSWWEELRFLMQVRARRFDVVIDLTDGDRSAFLSRVTGAPVRLGYNRDHRWRGRFYSRVIPSAYGSMHMVDYHQLALTELGVHDKIGDPKLYVPEEQPFQATGEKGKWLENGQKVVLLHAAARYTDKAWPLERFAMVADWLSDKGMRVALIGSQQERLLGQQIYNLARHKPINLMGSTRLSQLLALMRQSQLVIANDGGPMHMAAAVGCPVLALFGPTDPAVWGPRGEKVRVLYKELDCRACFYPGCSRGEESCMRQISVEEVCQAAQSLLVSHRDRGNLFVPRE